MDKFVNLHVHSTYSFVDGYGTPKQYFDVAEKIGQSALAVTDHGNVSSHYKWYKEGLKRNIKPILGCEMYVVENLNKIVSEKKEREYNHITVIAINNKGYENLLFLVTKSWQEGFYYKPRIDYKSLVEHKEGLIFTTGCLSSMSGNAFKAGKDIEESLKKQKQMFGSQLYAEVQPLTFEEGSKYIEAVYKSAKKLNIPMVATMDCHYPEQSQSKIQEIMLCIQSNDQMFNPKRWKFDQEDFYLKSRAEMEQSFKVSHPKLDFTEAFDNTVKIAKMVDFKFPTAYPLKFPISEEEKIKQFKQLCWKGMLEKGLDKNKEYVERAKYEIELIIKKDFVDYFLVIADLIQYAKSHNILVGPARGSAAGSLVCYLATITEVDPLKHDLIFERFIDINREDIPDIDIDFEDEKRYLLKEYLEKKYGKDKVGDIATFGTFKGKMIISDLGRVYKIPFEVTDKIKNLLVQRSGGDSRASFTVEDTFKEFEYPKEALKQYPELQYASAFEGQIRNLSKHAAGVVVSNEPLTKLCAIYQSGGEKVLSMDYYDVSSVGLLKIDILGLKTLTFLQKAKELVKQHYGTEIDYYKLSLEDPEDYEAFNDPERLFGIFQFDGQAVNQVCRQVHPKNFSELSDIDALARPGPLNSGSTTLYIQRKIGNEPVTYTHPLMEKITSDTYGIVIYQEQVMKVMREIGNMSWKDTAEIRKNISRSRGMEAFNEFKAKFDIGALENGLKQKEIDEIWNSVCTFGSWAFNKSHSVSYTYISYWAMWMKVHYPIEYFVSILSTVKEDTVKKVLKEFRREGFKVYPVDINKSKETFTIDEKGIRLGFLSMKGIGSGLAQKLVVNQPYESVDELQKKMKGKRLTKKILEKLEKLGAFDNIKGEIIEQINLFNDVVKLKAYTPANFQELSEWCPYLIELNIEKDWKEFMEKYLIKYPEPIKNLVAQGDYVTNQKLWESPDRFIMGIAYDKNPRDKLEVASSKGKILKFQPGEPTEFCNMIIEDDTDFITVRIGVRIYQQYKKLIFEDIKEDDVLYIRGKMGSGIRMFFANEIIVLSHLKQKIENNIEPNFIEKRMIKGHIGKFINL